jgi:hypothetical protein
MSGFRAGGVDGLPALVQAIYADTQSERLVYPTLATGATVQSANADWVYGGYATIVPTNAIDVDYQVLAIVIEDCNENAVYQLELYKGAGDNIVNAVRFAVEGGFFGNQVYVIGSERVDANDQIRARLASSNGAAAVATITMSIVYYRH